MTDDSKKSTVPSFSLVDVGKLAEPASKLIDKISDAIGGVFRPNQIRRIAAAEADAEKIRVLSAMEISDIQERGLKRFIFEEAKKQENIEAITTKAIPHLSDQSRPERVDSDWIANFFDKSRLTSDAEMQELWARILAGEANEPGAFSKRTVNHLSSLDRQDAETFATLCAFVCNVGDTSVPIIYDVEAAIYQHRGLRFGGIKHLDDIGLVTYGFLTGFQVTDIKPPLVSYFGAAIHLTLPDAALNLDVGHVLFTQVGTELARVCQPTKVEGFEEYLCELWASQSYFPRSDRVLTSTTAQSNERGS